MPHMPYLSILITIGYLVLIILLIVFIVISVNKFLSIKKEQNDLLREIIRKIDLK